MKEPATTMRLPTSAMSRTLLSSTCGVRGRGAAETTAPCGTPADAEPEPTTSEARTARIAPPETHRITLRAGVRAPFPVDVPIAPVSPFPFDGLRTAVRSGSPRVAREVAVGGRRRGPGAGGAAPRP